MAVSLGEKWERRGIGGGEKDLFRRRASFSPPQGPLPSSS